MSLIVTRPIPGWEQRRIMAEAQHVIRARALKPNGYCLECDAEINSVQRRTQFCSDRCRRLFNRYGERSWT